MRNIQDNPKKLLKQICYKLKISIFQLGKDANIPHSTLYTYLNDETGTKTISDANAIRLINFCKKNKIKLKMKDLRPHMNYPE